MFSISVSARVACMLSAHQRRFLPRSSPRRRRRSRTGPGCFVSSSSPLQNKLHFGNSFPDLENIVNSKPTEGSGDGDDAPGFPDVIILGDFGLVEALLPGDSHLLDCVTV